MSDKFFRIAVRTAAALARGIIDEYPEEDGVKKVKETCRDAGINLSRLGEYVPPMEEIIEHRRLEEHVHSSHKSKSKKPASQKSNNSKRASNGRFKKLDAKGPNKR